MMTHFLFSSPVLLTGRRYLFICGCCEREKRGKKGGGEGRGGEGRGGEGRMGGWERIEDFFFTISRPH